MSFLAHLGLWSPRRGRDPSAPPRMNRGRAAPEHAREGAVPPVQAFVDGSVNGATMGGSDFLVLLEGISAWASSVTCVVPSGLILDDGWATATRHLRSASPAAAFRTAVERAGRARHHLAVLLGPSGATPSHVRSLIAVFDHDPLFGSIHPRFACGRHRRLLPVLATNQAFDADWATADISRDLPLFYVLPEYVSRCFVLRRELVANLEVPAGLDAVTSVDVVFDYLRRGRRLGFRSAVHNRTAVPVTDKVPHAELLPSAPGAPNEDGSIADRRRFSRPRDLSRERVIAAMHARPRRLLVDVRGLTSTMNGTCKTILGICDGLQRIDSGWTVELLARRDTAERHALGARYAEWPVHLDVPARSYAASVRLSQPWTLSEIRDLHEIAACNAYLMLDAIGWDIIYGMPRDLDAVWRFVASHADGLLFVSDFSRRRFSTRFAVHPEIELDICHNSLDPAEYALPHIGAGRDGDPFWFVVGNDHDLKHVGPTVDLLAKAFPNQRLVAIGTRDRGDPRIAVLQSGVTSEIAIQRHYAHAQIVVFPSFYEGFGLPIVNGLAYGRTVVARESALLHEIAAVYCGPGRLVSFATPNELVERLQGLNRATWVPELTLRREGRPYGWCTAATVLLEFVDRLARGGPARAGARQEVMHLLGGFET